MLACRIKILMVPSASLEFSRLSNLAKMPSETAHFCHSLFIGINFCGEALYSIMSSIFLCNL